MSKRLAHSKRKRYLQVEGYPEPYRARVASRRVRRRIFRAFEPYENFAEWERVVFEALKPRGQHD